MKTFAVFLIVFGMVVIAYPEFLAYLIGGFFLFIGINILLAGFLFKKKINKDFVKFGDYKIFRD